MAASPQRGTATVVEHGGRTYRLMLTNRSMLQLEEKSGLGVQELGERLSAMSLKAVCDFFWAARLHAEPGLKHSEAVDDLDPTDLAALAEGMGDEISRYFGVSANGTEPDSTDAAEEGEETDPPAAAG